MGVLCKALLNEAGSDAQWKSLSRGHTEVAREDFTAREDLLSMPS